MIEPALAIVDFSSIAMGIEAADAMVKRAQIDVIRTGTVQPGRYIVMIGGPVGEVEESLDAGREAGGSAVLDYVLLPQIHPEVVEAVGGGRVPEETDSLGVVETTTVSAAIHAADAGIKGAEVRLVEVRLADGLGGKGIVLYSGLVADVEAAVAIGVGVLERPELLVRQVVIPQLHPAMWENVAEATRFSERVLEHL
ncbi:MAG: BMC domain-containing protein [Fidelibacterota bacterium]|nr:MAG: BMC domain-containing protein [Candidatus Neomarinimicrobiota bacterium]